MDTNILVHAHRRDAALHDEARSTIKALAEGDVPWAVCFHSFVEFYGIVSHTKIWTEASTPEQAQAQINAWRESPTLRVLTENSADLETLTELAVKTKIRGAKIHDTRIANCCLVNGVRELWTVDRDFSRFSALKTRNPLGM
ncbi:MAG: TA system VapC family ribonuclease toxin [Verrucomicrobiota bacterium]